MTTRSPSLSAVVSTNSIVESKPSIRWPLSATADSVVAKPRPMCDSGPR